MTADGLCLGWLSYGNVKGEVVVTVFKMTQMSMTMLEGIVINWLKQEGDSVNQGEPLLEVQTDKVVMEMTSPATGIVVKHLAMEGDTVPIGGDLCIISDTKEEVISLKGNLPKVSEESLIKQEDNPFVVAPIVTTVTERKPKASPLAKRIAKEEKIDLADIVGTGPDGLIVKADILKSKDKIGTFAAPAAGFTEEYSEIIPLKGIRKVTADQMMRSKQSTAAVTTVAEVDLTQVAAIRKTLPVSYTSFAVRASVLALKEYPIMNSSIINDEICVKQNINISIAVATNDTLVTPVIQNAGNKNLLSIAEDIDELTVRSRANKLMLQDFEGGTFTVTNSGVFGSVMFTPIINYPQCAILGIGKIMTTPVVRNDEIIVAPMMYLCLSYDHRIVDGMTAVLFLQRIKYYLENPMQLIKKKERS